MTAVWRASAAICRQAVPRSSLQAASACRRHSRLRSRPTTSSAAALLLIGLLTRRLVLLAGLALVRHGCFLSWEHQNNGSGSAPFRQRLRWCDTARAPEFRFHQTNTQTSPNEQAGTTVPEQPSVALTVGSLLKKQGNSKISHANPKMSDANQSHPHQNLSHPL